MMKLRTITHADLEKTDLEEQMLKVVEEGREAVDAFFSYNNAKNEGHIFSRLPLTEWSFRYFSCHPSPSR